VLLTPKFTFTPLSPAQAAGKEGWNQPGLAGGEATGKGAGRAGGSTVPTTAHHIPATTSAVPWDPPTPPPTQGGPPLMAPGCC